MLLKLSKVFTCEHLVCLQIFLDRFVNDLLRECPVVVRICFQPVTGKLFVKRRLPMSRFITVCRPEAGAVRCEHLITDNKATILVKTKFKFGICNDDSFT